MVEIKIETSNFTKPWLGIHKKGKTMNPYIGITDFTDPQQIRDMLGVLRAHRQPGSNRLLHAGVMMSYKTLLGLPTKWAKVFPLKEEIRKIFNQEDSNDLYRCLHYASYEDDPAFEDNLTQAIFYGGDLDALQLDMIWPNPESIYRARYFSRCSFEIVLQIGAHAFEEVDHDPEKLVNKLREYEECQAVDRVLLDKSMGRGLGMDAIGLLPYARAITDAFPSMGLVVAGGLGPYTTHLVQPLLEEFPDVSTDAQGQLRPSGRADLEPIAWGMAGTYLVESLKILK